MLDLCASCDTVQNVYLSWTMAIPLITAGVSALGGLLGNRKSQAQKTGTQNIDVTEMPQYDDEALYMRNLLLNQFLDRVRNNDDFFGGYRSEGIKNINTTSDIADRNIMQTLAARGLNTSQAGASSMVQAALNRLNQQSSFLNAIPLLQDQRAKENLNLASDFFARIPAGARKSGTITETGVAQQPGNMLGGLFGGLGTSLAYLYGQGAFGKSKTPTTPTTFGTTPNINYDIVPPGYQLPK